MTPVHSHTGREEVTEYINDAYRTSPSQYKAPASTKMWSQQTQRERLKKLSADARTPVLQFLRDRPPLMRTLKRDSPHLEEAFLLAVDAIGQANETEQWATLAEILMDACMANPAASIDLHEVLYGVITPAGQWGFWGQGALKKLVSPISSIAGFGLQAFRNNQPREIKHSVSRSAELEQSDSEDFQIGSSRSDSLDSQPRAGNAAASTATNRLAPSFRTGNHEPSTRPADAVTARDQRQTNGKHRAGFQGVSSSVPAPSDGGSDKGLRSEPILRPSALAQHQGLTSQTPPSKPPSTAAQASLPAVHNAMGQSNIASASDRPQPVVRESASERVESHEAAKAPGASSSQPRHALDVKTDQVRVAENQRNVAAGASAASSSQPAAQPSSSKQPSMPSTSERSSGNATRAGVPASAFRQTQPPTQPSTTAAKSPLPHTPSGAVNDGEVWFPMPSRSSSRVTVAMPWDSRSPKSPRQGPVDPLLASLPDPHTMSEKDLLEFDFSAIEKRLDEMAKRTGTYRQRTKAAGGHPPLPPNQTEGASSLSQALDVLGDGSEESDLLPSLSNWLADTEAALHQSQSARAAGRATLSPVALPRASSDAQPGASVIPSRVDQLRSRDTAQPKADTPPSPDANATAVGPILARAAASTTGGTDEERAESLLEELMQPAQRKPYREFKKMMEERAKQRQTVPYSTLPDTPPGTVPSLEAARAALESFQKERMATLGSVSEPLARAQAQLASLEVTLSKNPLHAGAGLGMTSTMSTEDRLSLLSAAPGTAISEAARPHLEAARRAREARKAAWANYRDRDSNLPEDFKRRMDEVYNPSEEHTAAVAEAVKKGVEDYKAGRVASRSEAVRARVAEVYKRNRPPLPSLLQELTPSGSASSTSVASQATSTISAAQASPSTSAAQASPSTSAAQASPSISAAQASPSTSAAQASSSTAAAQVVFRPSHHTPPPSEVFKASLPAVAEAASLIHKDPEDELEVDVCPPLGMVPVLPPFRGPPRPAMLPGKPRPLGPGRGPMPVPSSTHPQSRPFGVMKSSLAIREEKKLQARHPGASLVAPKKSTQTGQVPPIQLPRELPSAEVAANLLAQCHSAEKRFEVTLPAGRATTSAPSAAAVLGADALDEDMAAKFIKENPLVPSKAASRSAASGSVPQARKSAPQVAPIATSAEQSVAAAAVATTAAEPIAPAVHKNAQARAADARPSSSAATQQQTQAAVEPVDSVVRKPKKVQAAAAADAQPSSSAAVQAQTQASAEPVAPAVHKSKKAAAAGVQPSISAAAQPQAQTAADPVAPAVRKPKKAQAPAADAQLSSSAAVQPQTQVAAEPVAPAVRKSKKAPAADAQPSSSAAAQPQMQAASGQPAAKASAPSAAAALSSETQAAAAPAAAPSAATAPNATATDAPTPASAGQPAAPQADTVTATEGAVSPPDDPASPTGEQSSKAGKQRMGSKQRKRQREAQQEEAKAAEEEKAKARAAEEEKERTIAEAVAAAQASKAEAEASAAKDTAPDAAVQDGDVKPTKKLGKKQRKKAKEEAAQAASQLQSDPTQAQDQAGPSEAAPTVAAAAAQSSAVTEHAESNQVAHVETAIAQSESAESSRADSGILQSTAIAAQPSSPAGPSAAQSGRPEGVDVPKPKPGKKRAKEVKHKAVPVASPAAAQVALEGQSGSRQQQEQMSPAVEHHITPDEPDESVSDLTSALITDNHQRQLSAAAQHDMAGVWGDIPDDSTAGWTQVNSNQQRQPRADAFDPLDPLANDWTDVTGNHQRQPLAEVYEDCTDDYTPVLNSHQRQYAEAHDAPTNAWTHVSNQQRHPAPEAHDVVAYMATEGNGFEQPAEATADDNGGNLIGLAALEGAPPQRRRGVRAGRRHKKRYGARDASARALIPDQDWPGNDSDDAPRDPIAAHHFPRSPLGAGPSAWGMPDAASSPVRNAVGLPPGLPISRQAVQAAEPSRRAWASVAEAASTASEQQARQDRLLRQQIAADAAQAQQQTARMSARTADASAVAPPRAVADQAAQANWPELGAAATAPDVRPSEAADAIVAELVAEAEAQRAAEKSTAQLRLRPRPQPRAQRRTAAPNDKVAAATAAAAAATAGIVTGSSHRAAPAAAAGAAPWEFNPEAQGSGDSVWDRADAPSAVPEIASAATADNAWQKPNSKSRKGRGEPVPEGAAPAPALVPSIPDSERNAEELVILLEAELEADYCCPLTLDPYEDPVRAGDGRTYERSEIEAWLSEHNTSPMTNMAMPHKDLVPDKNLLRRQKQLEKRLDDALKRLGE